MIFCEKLLIFFMIYEKTFVRLPPQRWIFLPCISVEILSYAGVFRISQTPPVALTSQTEISERQ
ncbi:MAG: hypothetical protein B6245_11910 [Desulfobacteraceae bacterium 4572_88]|nr:MAG: hypothetical protein B6245_11910 [Desulfobacteraceae bacterium 4572_88]